MRIGVYTIALNEAQFVDRWFESARAADYWLVADTGSTDGMQERLQAHGVDVRSIAIRPWRFDDARNAALAMVPADIDVVVALDMDEVLRPGWRERVIRHWTECTRLRYRYVWSWTEHKQPDVMYYDVKITTRHGWRWRYPVHEVLFPTISDAMVTCDDILVEHHPDYTKPRSQYLPLLQLAVQEDRHDSRCSFLLAREYFAQGQYAEAIQQYESYLALPAANWFVERAAAMRHVGKSHEVLGNISAAHTWFSRATIEDPTSREVLVDAGRFLAGQGRHHAAIDLCERVMHLSNEMSPQQDERYARAEGAYDVAAVAYFSLGDYPQAVAMAEKAVELNPHEPRLQANLEMIRTKLR